MNRQEYQFLEMCRLWGGTPNIKKAHIVGYVRHKRAAGFSLVVGSLAAAFYYLLYFLGITE